MRKLLLFFAAVLAASAIYSGCSGKSDRQAPQPEPTTGESYSEFGSDESFTDFSATASSAFSNERAYCVMIDNDSNSSRPHAGLEDAYIVYEMYVEGKATRLMAVFKGVDTKKIGPVRSSRHYFLDYVLDNDALYSHAGFSPLAMEQITSYGIDNLNGLVYEPTYYWRERKYKGDYHSLFTSVQNLDDLSTALGYRQTSDVRPFNFSDDAPVYNGDSATDITIPYADFYYVSYKYDPSSNLYDRYINSELHPTQSGAKLSAGQIIIQFADNYSLGDGSPRQELKTTGTGEGIFISDGMQIPITWKRASRTDKLKFYTSDGNELVCSSQKTTYVQVLPSSLKYSIK